MDKTSLNSPSLCHSFGVACIMCDRILYHLGSIPSRMEFCLSGSAISSILSRYLSDLDILSCLVAAISHDVAHPGLNNPHLVRTHHPLAITCEPGGLPNRSDRDLESDLYAYGTACTELEFRVDTGNRKHPPLLHGSAVDTILKTE